MSTVMDEYETSMLELESFIRGRESGKREAMTKSRVVSDGDAERQKEISLIHRGLDEIKKANLGGQLTDQSYTNLRRMALNRLEQLGAADVETATLAKGVISGVRYGSVAPLAGVQSLITLGNLNGRCSAEYLSDLANLGR